LSRERKSAATADPAPTLTRVDELLRLRAGLETLSLTRLQESYSQTGLDALKTLRVAAENIQELDTLHRFIERAQEIGDEADESDDELRAQAEEVVARFKRKLDTASE
jgi:hypothetical protein